MANSIDLKGRIAVVTGAAQGIGFAVAERLVQSGATVAVWDRDATLAAEAVAQLGGAGKARSYTVEQADATSVAEAARQTEADLGRIDVLVNNAGISGPTMPVVDYPVDEWRRIVDIDLNGVFYCCKAVVPGMVSRGYGRIVNIASIAGKEGNPNAAAYSAAKAGVIALTKSLGKELSGHDIAVNCVTPAAAKTRIFDQISQQHIDYMLSKIPRGRFLKVEEAASMIAWLVSAENSFTTGAVFDLSGGRATY
jgi:3-oxoacyl-[acyl-carrier protein] reductase